MIIYACESGEYSDYRVDALFSTEADAELYINAHGGRVVERSLDHDVAYYRQGLKPYWVLMERDGTVRVAEVNSDAPYKQDQANHFRHQNPEYVRDEWIFYMWAKDTAHAVKIANERRTQLLATDRWYPVPQEAG